MQQPTPVTRGHVCCLWLPEQPVATDTHAGGPGNPREDCNRGRESTGRGHGHPRGLQASPRWKQPGSYEGLGLAGQGTMWRRGGALGPGQLGRPAGTRATGWGILDSGRSPVGSAPAQEAAGSLSPVSPGRGLVGRAGASPSWGGASLGDGQGQVGGWTGLQEGPGGSGLGGAQGACEDPCRGCVPGRQGRWGSARCWRRGRAAALPGWAVGSGQEHRRPSGRTEGVSFLSWQLRGGADSFAGRWYRPAGLSPRAALPGPAWPAAPARSGNLRVSPSGGHPGSAQKPRCSQTHSRRPRPCWTSVLQPPGRTGGREGGRMGNGRWVGDGWTIRGWLGGRTDGRMCAGVNV